MAALGDFHGILRVADGTPHLRQLLNDAVPGAFALAAAAFAPIEPFTPAAILRRLGWVVSCWEFYGEFTKSTGSW